MTEAQPRTVIMGVVGATGAVGAEMLGVLADRSAALLESSAQIALDVRAFASERSAGKQVPYGTSSSSASSSSAEPKMLTVQAFTVEAGAACDVLLLAS